ncbi:MAG TPA: aminoglycoside phosphotransferase family protein [Vicinamibacterales bacterium]|nr:aminoglycoside phosphotransferase family protein [Vicinamibacterales bacterium]
MSIERIVKSETSLIAFGERDRHEVVLKVARTETEWRSGELLSKFDGAGMLPALEVGDGAVLMDRLEPGHDLSALVIGGRDDEATGILAGIIARMDTVRPSVHGVPAAGDLVQEFQWYRHNCDGLMPDGMIDKAERLFVQLCASQSDVRILHGDLHHYNVLFDSRRGWLAIDPSGIHAELEYEVGASLRNPIDAPDLLAQEQTAVRRLRIYKATLGLNADRALRWAFCQAVLAALWPSEEGVGTDVRGPFIAAATAMLPLL